MPNDSQKACQECGTSIHGREDKKFCSEQCKNTWNNRRNRAANAAIRRTNAILRKNRRILLDMNPTGKKKVKREDLIRAGFDFNYFTEVYQTKKEQEYRYCYDQGYLEISPGWYILVEKKEFS
ncbi:MAG: DUF2116 family Zn-ribbon domain-containing protein [Flavobacteriales bacterium]|nr:DUF2116 family Zn-ribbon domain-containing protein [Flavobacteriales bacterium]